MLQLGGKFYHVPGKSNIFSSHAYNNTVNTRHAQRLR